MTRIGTYIFACGIAAFSTAAIAQVLPKGTRLPNDGGVIIGYGVGPAGNATYITTKGPKLQLVVNKAVAAEKVTGSVAPRPAWNVVKNPPGTPAPAPVKLH